MKMLTFEQLKIANISRDALIFKHLSKWSITDYACAVAGEVGEACNFIKKIHIYPKVMVYRGGQRNVM